MSNPYDYIYPVVNPNMFFGRQSLVTEITKVICSPQPRSYIVFGGRRCGKTSLLRAIEREFLSRNSLTEQLAVLPVYIDLNYETITTRQALFETVLYELHRVVTEQLPVHLTNNTLGLDPLNLVQGFDRAILSIMKQTTPFTLRVVMLMDESEHLFVQPWAHDLHANLRALVSNRPALRDYLEIVMVGSSRLHQEYHREGSPLRNILVRRTLRNLSVQEVERLVNEPTGDSALTEATDALWQETAGHPFLSQYIMYHLWEAGLDHATVDRVAQIVHAFHEEECRSDFSDWCEDLGQAGQSVYSELTKAANDDWVPHGALLAAKLAEPLQLLRSLDSLCFHGIAEVGSPKRYRTAGRMFRRWFVSNVLGEGFDPIDAPRVFTPTLLPSQRKHLNTQRAELDKHYDSLTSQIAALDIDIGQETQGFRKQPLVERRSSLNAERTAIITELAEIERQLAGADPIPDA